MQKKDIIPVTIACLIILIIVFLIVLPSLIGARRHAWPSRASRAKSTLRSAASSQMAFKEQNEFGFYGTFQEIKDTLNIAEGYTLSNMIENYSMTWEVNNVSTISPEGIVSVESTSFAIVAYPNGNVPYLATFGVTEDNVVRVYNPDNYVQGEKNEFIDKYDPWVRSWDPIL
jgi:hypothetical protein